MKPSRSASAFSPRVRCSATAPVARAQRGTGVGSRVVFAPGREDFSIVREGELGKRVRREEAHLHGLGIWHGFPLARPGGIGDVNDAASLFLIDPEKAV